MNIQNGEGKPNTNQKGINTMKKSTMKSLVAFLNGETVTNIDEIKQELEAELARDEEKAQNNRELYATAHEVVIAAMRDASAPATIGEIYSTVEDELPEGFTKGKLTYAITRMWVDEFEKSGDRIKTYSLR